jgi:hypothetical protein
MGRFLLKFAKKVLNVSFYLDYFIVSREYWLYIYIEDLLRGQYILKILYKKEKQSQVKKKTPPFKI